MSSLLSLVTMDLGPLRRHREFRLLFAGQALSFLGSMITYVAVPYQAYQLTGSTLVVGLISFAELVPLVAGSLAGGALADAFDRRRLVVVSELARGKAGTAIGRLAGLLATVKGLPLSYNRDLQEDKPPVFAARRDVAGAIAALTVLVAGLEIDRERAAAAAADPLLLATDAAEALVREGVPFREAHEQVASAVRSGEFVAPSSAAESVASRSAPGPGGVREALAEARRRFT